MAISENPCVIDIEDPLPNHIATVFSESGSLTIDILYQYFDKYFLPWLRENQIRLPVIVFIDGLPISLLLSQFCCSTGIILLSLPAKSSDILKPTYGEILELFTTKWEEEKEKLLIENRLTTFSARDFLQLLKITVDKVAVNALVFENSFRACGNV